MKKLFYLFLVIPFAMMISSCSDDKDLPNVEITMSFDNAVVADGTVYVVQDEVLSLTGISTKATDAKQQSAIANIRYFWNGYPAPQLTWGEFPLEIDMAEVTPTESGKYTLGIDATLLETDKSISYCSLRIPIQTVETAADLPNGEQPGEVTLTFSTARSQK